jgi:hypothetical protein
MSPALNVSVYFWQNPAGLHLQPTYLIVSVPFLGHGDIFECKHACHFSHFIFHLLSLSFWIRVVLEAPSWLEVHSHLLLYCLQSSFLLEIALSDVTIAVSQLLKAITFSCSPHCSLCYSIQDAALPFISVSLGLT